MVRVFSRAWQVLRERGLVNFCKEAVSYVDYKYLPISRNSRKIREEQRDLLSHNYPPNVRKLIIFLTRGYDTVSGGVLATTWHYNASLKMKHVHGAEVLMCTLPGDPPLLRYTKFENQNQIYTFSEVVSYFKSIESLIVHIPEYAVGQFLHNISKEEIERLKGIGHLHLNIALQNIRLLESMEEVNELKKLGTVTCTTGHERYTTAQLAKELGCPVHKLSVYVSPEQYKKRSYSDKDNLLIVSPDIHPKKRSILKMLRETVPHIRVQIIENMTYEEYKELLSKAKWALTFGEGLDGYFVETVFSGGIAFAVYNSDFFTEDFKQLKTVYEDYDTLARKLCSDLTSLDIDMVYAGYQRQQHALCSKYYDAKEYMKNWKSFYEGQYTYK
jgi:hypothetical protein